MNRGLPARRLVLLTMVLAAFCACARQHYKLETGAAQNLHKAEWLNFPESFRMVHRVRLNVRGRCMDFIGYLAVNGACLRAVAVMEIGGELLDLLSCNGELLVLKNPGRIPQKPLKRGVLGELSFVFTPAAFRHAVYNDGGDSAETITAKVKGDMPVAGGADKIMNRVELQLFQNARLFSEIDIHSFRIMDGWPHPVPDRFTLRNRRWGYVMEVELLRLDMRPVEKKVFSGR